MSSAISTCGKDKASDAAVVLIKLRIGVNSVSHCAGRWRWLMKEEANGICCIEAVRCDVVEYIEYLRFWSTCASMTLRSATARTLIAKGEKAFLILWAFSHTQNQNS